MSIRVSAYAVVVRDDRLLLSRVSPGIVDGGLWTMPGGGIDPYEDPADAAVREVAEETGYDVELDELLGIDSLVVPQARLAPAYPDDLHAIRICYRAHVVAGDLRHEAAGSTDRAEWVPLTALDELPRVSLVDVARRLAGLAPLPR